MKLIDLSRELYHRTQVHPSHPPVIITTWNDGPGGGRKRSPASRSC